MTAPPQIAIVDDERFDEHRWDGHPERPERLAAARSGLFSAIPEERRLVLETRRASSAELSAVHAPRYLDSLQRALSQGRGQLDPDTYFCPATEEAASRAAGSAAELSELLLRGEVSRGVALLRPPGHHAEPDRAMGFCMLNNVAIAARAALAAGAERVAIVDWDVHHGNGTQAAFYDDPRVLFISLHQYPFYPGTGAADELGRGDGVGYTVNLALPARQGPETYAHAFRRVVVPVLTQFAPDLILVSAGFDAHLRDPLANMGLDDASYRAMASALVAVAERVGHGRVVCVLEGGYDLEALQGSVSATAMALGGQSLELSHEAPPPAGKAAIDASVRLLSPYWQLS